MFEVFTTHHKNTCEDCAHNARQIDVLITLSAQLQRVINLLDRVLSLPEYDINPYTITSNTSDPPNATGVVTAGNPYKGERISVACILKHIYLTTNTNDHFWIYVYHETFSNGRRFITGIDTQNGTVGFDVPLHARVPKGSQIAVIASAGNASGYFTAACTLIPAFDTPDEQFKGRNW